MSDSRNPDSRAAGPEGGFRVLPLHGWVCLLAAFALLVGAGGQARAGEINIVAFGGLYQPFGAEARVSDTPASNSISTENLDTGQGYSVRMEGFSTRPFSDFFGFGLGVTVISRDFDLKSSTRSVDVDADSIELSLSMLFRKPTGDFRPYAGTGLSILINEYEVTDRRTSNGTTTTTTSNLSQPNVGWHFIGGLKWFLPPALQPEKFSGRFFLAGEYRYLIANTVTEGKSFDDFRDRINGNFFLGGIGYQF